MSPASDSTPLSTRQSPRTGLPSGRGSAHSDFTGGELGQRASRRIGAAQTSYTPAETAFREQHGPIVSDVDLMPAWVPNGRDFVTLRFSAQHNAILQDRIGRERQAVRRRHDHVAAGATRADLEDCPAAQPKQLTAGAALHLRDSVREPVGARLRQRDELCAIRT